MIGAVAAAVVFYLRRSLLETEAYGEEEHESRGTIKELLTHKREALLVIALTMGVPARV
ncbi:hypothetical protein ACFLIM_04600 [Nonomuraea sp. M3C6]|uniref:Uncharacterized protein n=1 Tax=Nonomuraea marmarensis TaxID=3351344 RepID=A0ABW7A541_9ACTN